MKLKERGTSVKTEFMAGMTTLFATVYILAVPAFLTLVFMPFTYNIYYGIAFGLISYIVISILAATLKRLR